MIRLIEALNYRCLRYVSQPLDRFHVLVGPNASGKTTFLDVVAFLGQLVSEGLDAALEERTSNFIDLVWGRQDTNFELAIEAAIPPERLALLGEESFDTIRYEVSIGPDPETREIVLLAERASLRQAETPPPQQRLLFPVQPTPPRSILSAKGAKHTRTVLNKASGGNDNFYSEVAQGSGKGWAPSFRLGPRRSALANLPEDEEKFPIATWLKSLLTESVQKLVLNSLLIKRASPPGQTRRFKPDGSNLPWVLTTLRKKQREDWVRHLRTTLPEIEDVESILRDEDRHRYLVVRYQGDLRVPAWMTSDGTLRILALTLPAYLPDFTGTCLIEEPENGIHPRAVETVFQSFSSVYDAQILLATHSPVVLAMADLSSLLCFAKTPEGETDIVSGVDHPRLTAWKGQVDLGTLFAAGVLG